MELGVRARLFAISVTLILVVGLVAGVSLSRELREGVEDRIEAELLGQARTLAALLPNLPPGELSPMVARLGADTGLRITVIGAGGLRVLADSHERLDRTEVELTRPEVRAALAEHREATAERYGTLLRSEALYLALPFEQDGAWGVVRVGGALEPAAEAVRRLRVILVLAALTGLVIAIFMSGLAQRLLLGTVRTIVTGAQAIAAGDARQRVEVPEGEELGGLAGSLNRVADQLDRTIGVLADERARFKEVLEEMSEAVVVLGAEQRVVLLNPAAEALLHLEPAAVGHPLIEYVRVPALQELVAEPVEPGRAEFQLPGQSRRLLATVNPRRSGPGCIVVVHDVTDVRRLERIRRDFVTNVSHELRTPVSIIRANAETLVDGALEQPALATRLLDGIHRNSERLSNIIADLLDLSRLEAGRYRIERQEMSIAKACQQALASLEAKAEDKRIGLATRFDHAEDLTVRGDPKALDHVLVNLIENAIKYTPPGGRVTVATLDEDDRVRVEVRDNGPGIAPHHRSRIFERFYRVDAGRSREIGGTGLGLSIVKHLVESMDGDVGVEPAEPEGSIFWFTLPASPPSPPLT